MQNLRAIYTILVLFMLLAVQGPIFADPPLPAPVGRVVWVTGQLKAVMPNKEERMLQKTSVIYLHDTLITDNKSTAEIVFTDNTLMTFRAGSTFRIDDYAYNPSSKTKSVGKYVTTLMEGGFRTITGAIAKHNPDDYKMNTPVATIGVRGTDYSVVLKDGELNIAYYEGKPCVSAGSKTVCLDSTTPFATVPVAANAVPIPTNVQPAVFREKTQVTPAKIEPFALPSSYTTPGGPITSFCITQ